MFLLFLKTFKKQFLSTFNKKNNWNATAIFNYCSFSSTTDNKTLGKRGETGFPALNENVEQGFFFPYGAVNKAQYSTRLLYDPQMHCTRNAFLLFSSEVSAYCNYLQIIYFMNSYHDKMMQKRFSTPEQ